MELLVDIVGIFFLLGLATHPVLWVLYREAV